MRLRFFSLFLTASLIFSLLAIPRYISQYQASAQETIQLSRGFFTENKGQWDPNILFVGGTDFGKVAFTPQAIYYQMDQSQDPVQLSFVGAGSPEIEGLELLPHYHNYFIGNDPSKWGIECRNFAQVTYTNIWEGIDLAYFFSPEGLKYEYYVHPGANLQDLQVQVRGAKLLAGHHCLELFTPRGALKDDQLLVYGKDSLASLEASFHVCDDIFSFAIDDSISRNETIVIDPIVYSTYLGGTDWEKSNSIVLDDEGCAYITGYTSSVDFPLSQTPGGSIAPGYDSSSNGDDDVFIVKLNPEGTELVYATYLGGDSIDEGFDIALDEAGCAYITGRTDSTNFPMTQTVGGSSAPGYDQTHNGIMDAFVVKLNSTGTELVYATFLGGSDAEQGMSIAVDSLGNAFVGGSTQSSDFPKTQTVGGALVPGYKQTIGLVADGFIVKLNPEGTELLFSTYLGGNNLDYLSNIEIDSSACVYVVGMTGSSDFPMTQTVGGSAVPGYDQTLDANLDGFVVKLNPQGTEIIYATFLGGNDYDHANSLAIDSDDNAYVVGASSSTDFPMTQTVGGSLAPGYDQTHNGDDDVFVVKLNPEGTELVYATYLGGSNDDFGVDIIVDPSGHAYVFGQTLSTDFSMTQTIGGSAVLGYDQTYNGMIDCFVVKLNPAGTEQEYATFLGGSESENARGIAIDTIGDAFVTGQTLSTGFPMTQTVGGSAAPGYDQTHNGGGDAFVVKFDLPKPILDVSVSADEASYEEGDLPVLTVELANVGNSIASSCDVLITLPPELAFSATQTSSSSPGTGNSRIFHLGDILPGGSVTFNVFLEVVSNVSEDSTVDIDLEASCLENSTDVANLGLLLIHTELPYPLLALDVSANPLTYRKGDLPVLTVELRNEGTAVATACDVLVALPPELAFQSYQLIVSTPETSNSRFFEVGNLPAGGSITFPVYVEVVVNVPINTSVVTGFDASCLENARASASLDLLLIHVSPPPDPTPPHLRIWAEVNKPSFFKGEEALLMVTVVNQGELVATNTRVKMTLPQELSFLRASRYRSVALTPSLIEFELGALAPNSVQTFQVDVKVLVAVSQLRSIPIHFDVNCTEKSSDFSHVLLQLIPQRSGRPDLYLGLYYRNASWDPQTASVYIPQDTPLEIDFVLTGAQAPYELSIDWGDGETEVLSQQTDLRQTLRHQFKSKGKKAITVKVTDQLQRSKTATLHMKVR